MASTTENWLTGMLPLTFQLPTGEVSVIAQIQAPLEQVQFHTLNDFGDIVGAMFGQPKAGSSNPPTILKAGAELVLDGYKVLKVISFGELPEGGPGMTVETYNPPILADAS